MPIEITLTTEEKVRITCNPLTASGRQAAIDGPLRAILVSGDGTSDPDPDNPKSLHLVTSDTPGDASFLLEADADMGEGVVLIQDTVTLHVQGAMAVMLGLSAGQPEPK